MIDEEAEYEDAIANEIQREAAILTLDGHSVSSAIEQAESMHERRLEGRAKGGG